MFVCTLVLAVLTRAGISFPKEGQTELLHWSGRTPLAPNGTASYESLGENCSAVQFSSLN